jgi:hypothetical protein
MGDALKVTVIATGFDRAEEDLAVEAQRDARRPAHSVLRETFAPATSRSPARPEVRSEPAAAYSTRRPAAAAAASLQAAAPRDTMPAVRERITFPSNADADWDIPTFQRRQGG